MQGKRMSTVVVFIVYCSLFLPSALRTGVRVGYRIEFCDSSGYRSLIIGISKSDMSACGRGFPWDERTGFKAAEVWPRGGF